MCVHISYKPWLGVVISCHEKHKWEWSTVPSNSCTAWLTIQHTSHIQHTSTCHTHNLHTHTHGQTERTSFTSRAESLEKLITHVTNMQHTSYMADTVKWTLYNVLCSQRNGVAKFAVHRRRKRLYMVHHTAGGLPLPLALAMNTIITCYEYN